MNGVNPNDAGSIKASFPGYAGWNDNASIIADYKATQGAGKGGPSSGGPGNAPSIDLVGITNAAYNTPDIAAANQSIKDTTDKITARQQALSDAQAEINDNPFYAEATRVGQSAKLTAQANSDMGVLQNSYNEAQNNLLNLKADAAVKVNAALGQYNIDNAAYQSKLQQFDAMLQAGAITNMSSTDLSSIAVQTGIPVSELQSIQTTQQNANTKLSSFVNNQGVVTVMDQNGKIVSQSQPGVGASVTPAKGSGSGSGAAGFKEATISKAISYLAQQDAATTGTKDHMLSDAEGKAAMEQILALVGGDQAQANALFNQAFQQGGYSKWNPPAPASSSPSNPLQGVEDFFGNAFNSLKGTL